MERIGPISNKIYNISVKSGLCNYSDAYVLEIGTIASQTREQQQTQTMEEIW